MHIADYKVERAVVQQGFELRQNVVLAEVALNEGHAPMASIGRMSKAKTVPEVPVSLAATCDQLPGALPKSASTVPGLIILSFR